MIRQLFAGFLFWYASAGMAETLNVYNWSEYLPQAVIDRFTEETGIKVNYSTFDSNEVMYAKLKTLHEAGGDSVYDIVVPSNYYVSRMAGEGLLAKLDHGKLTHFKNLDPKLLDRNFDPGNVYSVPYLWGTTGIGLNTGQVEKSEITAWSDLWKPQYRDSVLLLNDMREVMGMGLMVLGYSMNERDPAKIKQAYLKLEELMPNVRLFDAESPKVKLLEGEVKLGMLWSGEAYMADREEAGIVEYVYPREGVALWIDNLAIPSSAGNPDGAHQFINFLLRPEIARQITEEIGYASPNLEAIKLLPREVRENPVVYPSDKHLKGAQLQEAVGDALPIYEKYWQQLKIAN